MLAVVVLCGLSAISAMSAMGMGFVGFIGAIAIIVAGGVAARIWCELLIILFRIHENTKKMAEERPHPFESVPPAYNP